MTGTIAVGRSADFLVAEGNPLKDFSCLAKPKMVVKDGRVYNNPKCKRYPKIDRLVDSVKHYDARFVARGKDGVV